MTKHEPYLSVVDIAVVFDSVADVVVVVVDSQLVNIYKLLKIITCIYRIIYDLHFFQNPEVFNLNVRSFSNACQAWIYHVLSISILIIFDQNCYYRIKKDRVLTWKQFAQVFEYPLESFLRIKSLSCFQSCLLCIVFTLLGKHALLYAKHGLCMNLHFCIQSRGTCTRLSGAGAGESPENAPLSWVPKKS